MAIQNRYFTSTAVETTLSTDISNTATSFVVGSLTGYPVSLPFTCIINRDQPDEEVIEVTGVSGTTITSCTRGVDGTSAVTHSAGATFEHGVSARDYNDPQAHMVATSGVHGVTGNVVGDSDVQTLTNKTLTSPTINGVIDSTATFTATTSTAIPVTVKAAASQTADLTRWQDSTGAVTLARILADGSFANLTVTSLTPGNVNTYAAKIINNGGVQCGVGSDANAAYIQTFSGGSLRLNWVGNVVQFGPKGTEVDSAGGLHPCNGTVVGGALWGGSGAPATSMGNVGDIYFRTDTPTTANQRIYIKTTSSVWTGIV